MDTDCYGMRDIWEKAHGLDLFNADDHNGDHHPRSSKVAVRERWSTRVNNLSLVRFDCNDSGFGVQRKTRQLKQQSGFW
ncbi:hypothetical protein N8660_02105 [Akkermansiaceae bacterium]|nr:hypothetical protein [Akkermansiaceae bacterium]